MMMMMRRFKLLVGARLLTNWQKGIKRYIGFFVLLYHFVDFVFVTFDFVLEELGEVGRLLVKFTKLRNVERNGNIDREILNLKLFDTVYEHFCYHVMFCTECILNFRKFLCLPNCPPKATAFHTV